MFDEILIIIIIAIVLFFLAIEIRDSLKREKTNKVMMSIKIVLLVIFALLSAYIGLKVENLAKDLSILKAILQSIGLIFILFFVYLQSIINRYFDLIEFSKNIFDGDESIVTKLNKQIIDLDSALLKVNKHPIIRSNDDFKPVIESLFKLGKTKDVALEFSFNCLQQISKTGFIQIDIPFKVYSKMLEELTDKSTNEIIGTFTLRPNSVYKELIDIREKNEINYLRSINEKKDKVNRIIVFEVEEINKILIDSIYQEEYIKNNNELYRTEYIPPRNTSRNNFFKPRLNDNTYDLTETPEIIWFNDNLKANKTFWTITPEFLNNINLEDSLSKIIAPCGKEHFMTDFGIFEGEILLIWRENASRYLDKNKFTGTLIMTWGKKVSDLNKKLINFNIDDTPFIFSTFDDLLKKLNEVTNDKAPSHLIDKQELKIFKSYYQKYMQLRNDGYKWSKDNYKDIDMI